MSKYAIFLVAYMEIANHVEDRMAEMDKEALRAHGWRIGVYSRDLNYPGWLRNFWMSLTGKTLENK